MSHSLPTLLQRRVRRVALGWLVLMAVAGFTLLAIADWRHWGLDEIVFLFPFALIQIICLSFWAVFAPFGGLARWSQIMAGAGVLLVSAFLKIHDGSRPDWWMQALQLLMETPLFLLIASWPLWLLRAAGGFRLSAAKQPPEPETASSRQFSIADLLAATLVVAVSLGLVRTAVSIETKSFAVVDESRVTQELWNFMIGALLTSIWVVLIEIPCVWAALVAKRRLRATVLLAVYAPMFAWGLYCWENWRRSNSLHFDATFAVMGMTVFATAFLSLWALRLSGVVLRRHRRKPPPAVDEGGKPDPS